ncbi:reverse transcriptase domain-containing protein [Tanacetum coccineum]
MDGIDIEDLTIEQYLELRQNHAPSVSINVDDMTIAEYMEYEKTIKTQDYDEYQPHSAKADVPTKYRDHLSPCYKIPDPLFDPKTNPYLQASQSPIHPKITKTPSIYTKENEEQSNQGLGDWFEAELEKCWKIQQKRDNSHSALRRQDRDNALRNWEARIDQLRRQEHEVSECKMVHAPKNDAHQKEPSQIERISSLPEKPNPGSPTIPCLVDIFNINAIADLGASINIMSESLLEELNLAGPKNANLIVEMADKTRCVPQGIVENVLVKIDKFSFTSNFLIINTKVLNNKTIILGRPFLANIHAEMDISTGEVSLGIKGDRVKIKMNKHGCNFTTSVSKHLNKRPMAQETQTDIYNTDLNESCSQDNPSQNEQSYGAYNTNSKTHWCELVRQKHNT